jgi:mannose-1-phosphate guanylyltransferase
MNMTPWGIILAGGDGTRLRTLTRFVSGDDRPKQFCAFFDGKTLLGRTRARLAPIIAPNRTIFVVVKAHEPFYRTELADVDESQIVVQPANKGTTAAFVYGLLRITRLAEDDPIVAFFPTDHDYADEARFAHAVRSAMDVARDHPGLLVLLGAQADKAEVEYGWIERGAPIIGQHSGESLFQVNRFWEKPSLGVARTLLRRGCFWNTFVSVGRAGTFLDILASTAPSVGGGFDPLKGTRAGPSEFESAARVYAKLPVGDFSRQVLAACTGRLAVLQLGKAGWSDLGTPERVRIAAELKARAWLRATGNDTRVRPFEGVSESGTPSAFVAWLEAYRRSLPKVY